MKHFIHILCIFFLFSGTTNGFALTPDSIGKRIENGRVVILHKVEKKETAYGIAKRYGVSVTDIYNANPMAKSGLKVGQILKVPTQQKVEVSVEEVSNGNKGRFHVVEKGETIYSISKKYNRSVDEIRKWNDLKSNELSIGQMLVVGTASSGSNDNGGSIRGATVSDSKPMDKPKFHVVEKGQTLYSISKLYGVSVSDIKSWNRMVTNELEIGDKVAVDASVAGKGYITALKDEDGKEDSPVVTKNTQSDNVDGNARFHTVQKGETLYSISRKYPATIEQIKEWNNLQSNELEVGQLLVVKEIKASSAMESLTNVNKVEETLDDGSVKTTTTKTYSGGTTGKDINDYVAGKDTKDDAEVIEDHEVDDALAKTDELLKTTKSVRTYEQTESGTPTSSLPTVSANSKDYHRVPDNLKTYEDTVKYGAKSIRRNVGKFNKTVETGICELIEDNHWDSKYNALHASAEIGTIIQVENVATGVSVMVKVVGRLIETADKPNLVIRISHHADERLAHGDEHFPVKLTYIP